MVPARDEEDLLPSALQALAEQRRLDGTPLSHENYEILLLINNSRDRSTHVAHGFQRLYPTLRLYVIERNFAPSHAHIGHVRRLLMDEACSRLELAGSLEAAILSTDSDSRVAPNWICRNLEVIANGAEAVGGRIVVLPCEQEFLDNSTIRLYRYDHLYARLVCWAEDRWDPEPHDPWPRHHNHFGASLAITPDAYRLAGRLPPRRFLEDVAFYDAMLRCDLRIRHSNRVRVYTSARTKGRTRFGFSRRLRDWQQHGESAHRVRVESVHFLAHMFRTRNSLRQLWMAHRDGRNPCPSLVGEVSSALGVSKRALTDLICASRFFGLLVQQSCFYERCRRAFPDWKRMARLTETVHHLQALFKTERRVAERASQMII